MTRVVFFLLSLSIGLSLKAQNSCTVTGVVSDNLTGELLFTATVYDPSSQKGVTTDIDGKFSIVLPYGTQTLEISLVGYEKMTKTIELNTPTYNLNIKLESVTLAEAKVTSSFITDERTTPYSVTTIAPKKIQEELASQDLPMILNSTPGVYATQQGGGDGDARITIRGFNQRNVAVMIDGVPVNDMENGWVYWSNWFGLDMATRSIQLQRGLGASKIAIPSIGGTMNIITTSLDSKAGGKIKQEIGTAGFMRTSFSLSTGRNEKGWGTTAAFSYKRGNGWVDKTFTEGYFYFLKVEKKHKNHLFSLSAFGAPQKHAQRSYKKNISFYDADYAASLGIDTTGALNRGVQFNEHWGYLYRTTTGASDTGSVVRQTIYEKLNYFHKPQITLKDFWAVNEKLSISTLAYLSIGKGGGTSVGTTSSSSLSVQTDYTASGQINFQRMYDANRYSPFSIDPVYSVTEHKSSKILRSSINNHRWIGVLSTFNYRHNDNWTYSGGLDFRDYKGEHYRTVYDLLGGDYAIDNMDLNASSKVRRLGDKIGYCNDGLVRWAGMFGQAEFKKGVWSGFLNLSVAGSGYKRINYFQKKTLEIDGNEFNRAIGYGDVAYYNGNDIFIASTGSTVTTNGDTTFIDNVGTVNDGYILGVQNSYTIDSKEAIYDQTNWKWLPGFTFKTGASYQINEFNNIYVNTGYLSRTPRFANVIDNNNNFYLNIQNEKIMAFELGYGAHYEKLAVNLNGYYTYWMNRPLDFSPQITIDDVNYTLNVLGINALHTGVELDVAYTPFDKLTLEGSVSLGNWTWQSGQDSSTVLDENGNPLMVSANTPYVIDFDAKGVHVGDAAQTQFAGIIRYEFARGAYIKTRVVHFANQYANFDPFDLTGDNKRRESWKMPSYTMSEIHLGYQFKLDKIRLDLRGSILNLFDITYLTDATNNDNYILNPSSDFDAKSAGVFYGQGRRYNLSLNITF